VADARGGLLVADGMDDGGVEMGVLLTRRLGCHPVSRRWLLIRRGSLFSARTHASCRRE
jgi:hypothetical protein